MPRRSVAILLISYARWLPQADFYRCSEHALEARVIDNETRQRLMRGAE
ncbi:TPA: hypothetical protein ACH0TE_004785 [Citrobacter farmeri]|nr:hypothetical protein [Citrobacter farmeri]HCD7631347.1 hypothetical protein [Citrobacter farmeri]